MFTIVYPKQSIKGALFPAISLQYKLWQSGHVHPLVTESTDGAAELVICERDGIEKGRFFAKSEGEKLFVTAGDLFGFLAAADYLTKDLFSDGQSELPEVDYVGNYMGEMLDRKTSAYRMMFHNVWTHDAFDGDEAIFGLTGALYEVAQILTYRPDVVGLNEFSDAWREETDLIELLRANGYEEVKPVNDDRGMLNTLFYNTEILQPAKGSCRYYSYGDLQMQNGFATNESGSYYSEDGDCRERSALIATFEAKLSGKRFTVCVTHLESNAFVFPQNARSGNPLREEQIEKKLLPFLINYRNTWGAPIFVGGDFNSWASYESWGIDRLGACRVLEQNGFRDTYRASLDKYTPCSTHGYPIFCEELDAYVDYDASLRENYECSQDHIYLRDTADTVGEVTYRNLFEKTILCTSDHCPVMLDFYLI